MHEAIWDWEHLATGVREIAAHLEGRISVQVVDSLTGRTWDWEGQERCPSASVIKLAIAWEAFREAEAALLHLDETVSIPPGAAVGGTGVLQLLSPRLSLTWRDLVTLMLVVSDNTATNLLIDRLGFDAINATARSLGLTQTVLQRKMMDFAARASGRENYMSAADAARLLAMLAAGAHRQDDASSGGQEARLSPDSGKELLAILERQQFNHKLPALLPPVRCAHKTGELPGLEHDAGIVYLPAKKGNGNASAAGKPAGLVGSADVPVVVVVFTWGLRSNADGARAIAEVARAV
ncbi:MAG: serine hydrolase, partial [Candidatus Bipolaricaulota bacterium]